MRNQHSLILPDVGYLRGCILDPLCSPTDEFYLRAANTRILLDAGTIFYAPVVSEDDRAGFEEYASEYVLTQYQRDFQLETKARFNQDYQFGHPVPDAFQPNDP